MTILVALAACLALATAAAIPLRPAYQSWRVRTLVEAFPDLSTELARHLVGDSDREWLEHAREAGAAALFDGLYAVIGRLRRADTDELRRLDRDRLLVWGRISRAFGECYDLQSVPQEAKFLLSLSPERYREYWRLADRFSIALERDSLALDERVRQLQSTEVEARRMGTPWFGVRVQLAVSRLEFEAGHTAQGRSRLEHAIAEARELHEEFLLCQALGELGWVHASAGEKDSCQMRFDEALRVARRHGLLEQAARILRFEASYARTDGRLALAADRLAEARRVLDVPQAGSVRLRMELEEAKFYAGLDCWDLVGRSVRRLPPLVRQFPHASRPAESRKYALDAGWLEARLAFAEGDVNRGNRLMQQRCDSMSIPDRRIGYALVFDRWAEGLLQCGRPAQALAICERGIPHCDSAHVPEREAVLRLRKIDCLQQLDRWDLAGRAIGETVARFRAQAPLPSEMTHELRVLEARSIHHAAGSRAARAHLQQTLDAFAAEVATGAPDANNYLALDEAFRLRDAVHDLAGLTPEQGYAFECAWRSLGGAFARASGVRGPRLGAGREALPGPPPARHLVYHVQGDRLLRWTATPRAVRLDTLALPPEACLRDVREALRLLQTEPAEVGSGLGPRATQALRALSEAVLPSDLVANADAPEPLLVSVDGPLTSLPFEALPVRTPRGERLLADCADVAYLHAWPARAWPRLAAAVRARAALVVGAPQLSPELRARYAAGLLAMPAEELDVTRQRWPGATVLTGEGATKPAVLAHADRARAIYLAVHHVRDPDSPFLGFVPLAAPASALPAAALLEIADVRSLDLRPCELVVLASCASGAPYRLATRPGPSLGDAFLEAGAHAVIQSAWDVGNRETSAFMRGFLVESGAGADAVTALARTRRLMMATPEGAAPRVWAAWSAHVLWPPASSGAAPERAPRAEPLAFRRASRPPAGR